LTAASSALVSTWKPRPFSGSIAGDSLAPRRVGELMFLIAQTHVDRVVRVSDNGAPRRAQDALWTSVRIVAEPGGAAALATLLDGGYMRVGVLVSGGNTSAVHFG
jgi:threonine dehydratase